MKTHILLLLFFIVPLHVTAMQQEKNPALLPSMQAILTELSIKAPTTQEISQAKATEPAAFFRYITKDLPKAYIEHMDAFIKNNQDYVKLLVKRAQSAPLDAAIKFQFNLIAYKNGFKVGLESMTSSTQAWAELHAENYNSAYSQAGQEYKIHLMPLDQDRTKIAITLFEELAKNTELQKTIPYIKTLARPESLIKEKQLPKIVIYVLSRKDAQEARENAQRMLDWIYKLFKDQPGCGLAPQFNEKVTDLIFFAQGNRDDKLKTKAPFEAPNYVYFKAKATGSFQDYHLINPAHKFDVSKLEKGKFPGYCSPYEITLTNKIQVFARAIPKGLKCTITLPKNFTNTQDWEDQTKRMNFAYKGLDEKTTPEITNRKQPTYHTDVPGPLNEINKHLKNAISEADKAGNPARKKELEKIKDSKSSAQEKYDRYIDLVYGGYGIPVTPKK